VTRVLIGFVIATASLAAQTWPAGVSQAGGANLPIEKIGANDLIAVSVYDAPEFTRTVRVGADGQIRLPMLREPIPAQGLLPVQLEAAIAAALKEGQILVDPFVTVTVVEYFSRPISVAGAVKNPITFQAVGGVTLLEAITRAGGLSPDAGAEILVSTRQPSPDGAPVSLTRRIAVKALIDAADPEVNLRLTGGEEIRVPEVGKVFVVGNVKRPGAYPVQGTAETTVLKMLAMAEGLAPFAAKEAYIVRRDDRSGARHELPIDLRKILQRKSPDVPLVANDVLYIPDAASRRAGLAALEKVLLFATGASTALIYGAAVR
jgi:polysaccharide export outer membrane protein